MKPLPMLAFGVLFCVLLGGVGPLLAFWRWPPLRTPTRLPTVAGLLCAAISLVLLLRQAWGAAGLGGLSLLMVLQCGPGLLAYGVVEFVLLVLNGGLDPSRPVRTEAVLHRRGGRLADELRVVEGPREGTCFRVSRSRLPWYRRAGAPRRVHLLLHAGWLACPWWESLE